MFENFKSMIPPEIFEQGMNYYQGKRIVKYNLARLADGNFHLEALVLENGERKVRIQLEFSNSTMKYNGSCGCHYNWKWVCKHQVAVMLYFFAEDYPKIFNKPAYSFGLDDLIQIVENRKNPVTLTYRIKGLLSENMVNFSFAMESPDLSEKNLKEIVEYVIHRWDRLKDFELPVPLTEESLQVVEYLRQIDTKGSRATGTVLFPKTPGNFAFLCNLARNNILICHENNRQLQLGKPLRPTLSVRGTEDQVTIHISEEDFKIYTNHNSYEQFWWTVIENQLHPVYLKDFLSLPPRIQISDDEKGRFLFEVLPKLRKDYNARISDNLLQQELLKVYPEIFLKFDFQNGEVICESLIRIKDREISGVKTLDIPLENDYHRSETNPLIWHGLDPESIQEYINFLEDNEFIISHGHFVIKEQEHINNFLTSGFLHIPEDWHIQTTESFDSLEVIQVELEPIIAISTDGQIDWFDFQVTYNLGGKTYTHQEIINMLRQNNRGESYIQIGNQFYVIYNDDKQKIIEENIMMAKKDKDSYKSRFYNLLYYRNLFLEKGIQIVGDRVYNELQEDLTQQKVIKEWEIPGGIADILRDYQKTGYYWMRFLHKYRFGGILADDMGLGKTVQVLTLLKGVRPHKPSLVICPRSLLYNWGEEIEKFYPDMGYRIYYGTPTERSELRENLTDYDVVITTYAIIGKDVELLNEYSFAYCILDEAQHIKNYRTKRAESVKNIRADHLLVLTGTPIENSVEELWSLFDFLMPGYLGTHSSFSKKYLAPIKEDNNQKVLQELKQRVAPFILRRNKSQVLSELPEKMVMVSKVAMTKLQEDVYRTILNQVRQEVLKSVQENGFLRSQITVLSALTKLRQVCNHPQLILPELDDAVTSGKIEALLEIVSEAVASGHKILVFSQFVKMLKLIENEFKRNAITYEYLDGSTRNRMERVKRFNDDPTISAFLISLKAGGTGLNLTSADIVIHVDPWWNPMVENQATDRAHRIGQVNKVLAYKLITTGTVEEKMLKLQDKKRNIFDTVIEDNSGIVERMTWEDVQDLFEM